MDDECVEMISEWPVKDLTQEECFNSDQDLVPSRKRICQTHTTESEADNLSFLTVNKLKRTYQDNSTDSELQSESFVPTKVPHRFNSQKQLLGGSRSHGWCENDSENSTDHAEENVYSPTSRVFLGEYKESSTNGPSPRTASEGLQKRSSASKDYREETSIIAETHGYPTAELMVMPRIGRWWRKEGHHLIDKKKCLPDTSNPNTLLFHVARLPEGQAFLQAECRRLEKQLNLGDKSGSTVAALASIEDWLGNTTEALESIKSALEKEPDNKEWRWLLCKIQRQHQMKQKQTELMTRLSPSHPVFPAAQQVERVSCRDLTFAEFLHKYSLPRRPVIITDLVNTMTTVPWNLSHIRQVAGDYEVKVKRSVSGSVEWAGLEVSRSLKVSQFLDNLSSCHDYLFDWSLPLHCPALAEEITIPRYFAGDFLQRTSQGSLYQDSWPSLFIAPRGVHSGLHVDAFASNFWMALFRGKKRWVFFEEEDTPCLYPVYAHSRDPAFEAKVTKPDLEKHPLLQLVHPRECVLHAGEILFVPGGSPHYVENLETTLAISANFVDLSNLDRVIQELEINALLDPRADDLLQQFKQPSFPTSMKSGMGDLPWKEFKSQNGYGVGDFVITKDDMASTAAVS